MAFCLQGQFLVAMPEMQDERFIKTAILLCTHSAKDGAMGFIINQQMPDLHLCDVMAQCEIEFEGAQSQNILHNAQKPIAVGGPLETSKGFVLHSADYAHTRTALKVNDELYVSTSTDILEDIAKGKGPRNTLIALGYCGWEPGQLENEIANNSWLNLPLNTHILFHTPLAKIYPEVLKTAGIELKFLSMNYGLA